jgi:IS30 family transposase
MAKKVKFVEIQVAKIDRQKFAVVPLHEYEAFVREHRLKKAHRRPRPSKIDQNPELAAFLAKVLGTKLMPEIMADCCSKFGAENVPAMSKIYAYWAKLRRQTILDEGSTGRIAAFPADRLKPHASKIERNPELATFLATTLGTKPLDDVMTDCLVKFGAVGTPSKSAVYRHWQKLRR